MFFTSFELYECFVPPQGIKPATDIFQGRMNSLFVDTKKLPSVYLDDILVTANCTFEDHLTFLDEILERLNDHRMYINAGVLRFWLAGKGYRPLKKRIESILVILPFKASNL